MYNFLVNEVAKDETQAEKYIEIVLKQRDKLNQKTLTSEKYNLIKEINSGLINFPRLLKNNLR